MRRIEVTPHRNKGKAHESVEYQTNVDRNPKASLDPEYLQVEHQNSGLGEEKRHAKGNDLSVQLLQVGRIKPASRDVPLVAIVSPN